MASRKLPQTENTTQLSDETLIERVDNKSTPEQMTINNGLNLGRKKKRGKKEIRRGWIVWGGDKNTSSQKEPPRSIRSIVKGSEFLPSWSSIKKQQVGDKYS
jgi:hypothetical protein